MYFVRLITKGLTTLFLFLTLNLQASELALQTLLDNKVYASKLWHNMLHFDGQPNLVADGFFLSQSNFSPKNEFIASFKHLQESKTCRFVARYKFINHELSKLGIQFQLPARQCEDYDVYRANVPAKELELVFASEILSSPTSMLGHVFLKANGSNLNGDNVEHTLSFFNEITTSNPVSLFSEALITGMPGYFIIRPFSESINRYIIDENRNLYTYSLEAEQYRTDILMAHLWELKQIKINYLFQSYNCATMTLFLLSLLEEDVVLDKGLWVTPIDVVKAAKNRELITASSGLFSSQYVDAIKTQEKQQNLSIVAYKAPQDKPSDSHLRAFYFNNERGDALSFSLAPVSKELFHNSTQFFEESSLVMGEITVGAELDSSKLFLSQLRLYEMNQFSNGQHSHFATGYLSEKHLSSGMSNHWYLNAAKGVVTSLSSSNLVYGDLIANANLASRGRTNIDVGTKFGVLYSVSSLKVHGELAYFYNTSSKLNKTANINASYQLTDELYIEFFAKYLSHRKHNENSLGLGISKLF